MMIEAIQEIERLKTGALPQKENLVNKEQVNSGIRWFVSTFGGVLAGYFAAWSGWFSADQIVGALNSPTFLALATSIVMGVWGIFNKTDKNIVASAAALPQVSAITVSTPALAVAAKAADPSTNVTTEPVTK
jgi:hypothetical protein